MALAKVNNCLPEPTKNAKIPPVTHSLDEALELIGNGRAQIVLSIVCGISTMSAVIESIGLSIILPASRCDLGFNAWEQGLLEGAIYVGIIASSYIWGLTADIAGRRITLKYALLSTSLFSAYSSLAGGFESLFALRFLTGVCMAALVTTVYAYLGEFTAPSKRSQILSFASIWGGVGIVYVSLVGWWILSYDWTFRLTNNLDFKPWRLLFIINSLPTFLNWIVFCFCPESPKFLALHGRNEEALEVLRKIYTMNKGADGKDGYGIKALRLDAEDELAQGEEGILSSGLLKTMLQHTLTILKLPYLKYFIICCVHNVGAFAMYGGLGLWFPEITNHIFAPNTTYTEGKAVCTILQRDVVLAPNVEQCYDQPETFLSTFILGAFSIVQGVITSIVLDTFDQKFLIMLNFALSSVCGVALHYATNSNVVAIMLGLEIVFAGCCITLINTNVVLLFPTRVRATAVAMVGVFGRLSSVFASSVLGPLILEHCRTTQLVLVSLMFVCTIITYWLPKK